MRDYFLREFNVGLLPFLKDEKGRDQLVDVLEAMAREIPVGNVLPAEERRALEGLLE